MNVSECKDCCQGIYKKDSYGKLNTSTLKNTKMILPTVFVCILLSTCRGSPSQVNDDTGDNVKDIVDAIDYSVSKENEVPFQRSDNGADYNGYVSKQRFKRSRLKLIQTGLLFARGLLARRKILNGARFTRTDGKVTHYEKGGGYSQMRADFQYSAKAGEVQVGVRDGVYQGKIVDFGDMTIKSVDNKAIPGMASEEPMLKILLKDQNGEVFKEDWVHYNFKYNVDR